MLILKNALLFFNRKNKINQIIVDNKKYTVFNEYLQCENKKP